MKKTLLLTTLLALSTHASEMMQYEAAVDVAPTKPNTKSWDISGGAPDVYLKIDGKKLAMKKECQNSYRCEHITFVSNQKVFYIEVYDKDLASDDLIGKGECRAGAQCKLGSATVTLSEGKAATVVLADARGDAEVLRRKIDEEVSYILHHATDEKKAFGARLDALLQKISQLRSYGKTLGKPTKVKLHQLLEILKQRSGDPQKIKQLRDILQNSPLMLG